MKIKVLPLDDPYIPQQPVTEERKEPEPFVFPADENDDDESGFVPIFQNGTLTTNTKEEVKVLSEADFAANTIREGAIDDFTVVPRIS